MKKVIFLLTALTVFTLSSCKKDNASNKIKGENIEAAAARDAEISKGFPVIEWDKTEHDFGNIKQGDKVSTTFNFTNVGKVDLIVTKVAGSCGCTTPSWPKEPVTIKSGESKSIDVSFNSGAKKNKTTNTVTFTTNTEKGREVVRIKAFVEVPEKKVDADGNIVVDEDGVPVNK